jgi:tetratricopeptide (TPR) repeat protein
MAAGSRAKPKASGAGRGDKRRGVVTSPGGSAPPAEESQSRFSRFLRRYQDWLIAAGLALATLLLYIPVTWNDFISFDDPAYVTDNPVVTQGLTLHGIYWAFTTKHFANWLPITWLSHMLDVSLFGLNPHGHHFTSALLHAVNAALVFAAILSLTRARWRALVVAAFFAVHPLRVESVAWLAERKDVLAATFFLLVLLAYVRYVRRPTVWRYLLVCLLLALGLMSKTMLVTVPCLLLILDWWPLRRWQPGAGARTIRKLVLEKVPLAALAAIASVWTAVLQDDFGAVQQRFTLEQRLGNAVVSVWRYLDKMVRPIDLSVMYQHPGSWPGWVVALAMVGLLLVTAVLFFQALRRPWALAGWLWFLGMLVPVSGIIQVGNQSMADRYTYLSGIGILIAVVWLAAEIGERSASFRNASIIVAGVLLLVFGYLTVVQQTMWRTTLDLFAYAAAIEPNNWLANHQVGGMLSNEGREEEAIESFRKAIRVEPRYPRTHGALGLSLLRTGQLEEATAEFKIAIEQDPKLVAAWQWLGVTYTALNDFDNANRVYAAAAQIAPSDPVTYSLWAQSLLAQDRPADAERAARRAVELNPNDARSQELLNTATSKAATRRSAH